jgi:site-specific recombinase
MKALISQIAPQLVDVLASVLVAVIGLAFGRLATLIKAHAKNTAVEGILTRLNDAVFHAVMALEQTTVAAAKAGSVSGKMPASIAIDVKAAALEEVKSHLGSKGIAELKDVLGIHQLDLDQFLGQRIEASVALHTEAKGQ